VFDRQNSGAPRAQRPANDKAFPRQQAELIELLRGRRNELEPAAISLEPSIAYLLGELRKTPGCLLARMSGAGATCFGIYESYSAAEAASRALGSRGAWWVRATMLGAG
jgi:4-diphosphocytidyl-2-C-methyl-D-erythritol kinase